VERANAAVIGTFEPVAASRAGLVACASAQINTTPIHSAFTPFKDKKWQATAIRRYRSHVVVGLTLHAAIDMAP
jgi:hypothetical protein